MPECQRLQKLHTKTKPGDTISLLLNQLEGGSKQSLNKHILAKRTLQMHARVSKTAKPAYENEARRY
jgi:hypothetical protein